MRVEDAIDGWGAGSGAECHLAWSLMSLAGVSSEYCVYGHDFGEARPARRPLILISCHA